jgi:hypothetical protein
MPLNGLWEGVILDGIRKGTETLPKRQNIESIKSRKYSERDMKVFQPPQFPVTPRDEPIELAIERSRNLSNSNLQIDK